MINSIKEINLMKKAWISFVVDNKVEENGIISDAILESWKRCKKLKVDPYQTRATTVLSPDLLQERKNANRELIEVASESMENIYNFIKGSEFMFGLFDKDGYALKIIGDQDVVSCTKKGNWIEGACWNELSAGTNGVSLAITENRPIQIRSYEHFCRCSHHWSGSAAPIHDPNGNLLGVLDLTGSYDLLTPHTLGILVSAAKSIERMLALKSLINDCQIANKYNDIIIDLLEECLMVLDQDGIITHINLSAADLLGIDKMKSIGRDIKQVIWADNNTFYRDIFFNGDVTDSHFSLELNNGSKIKCIYSKRDIIVNNSRIGIVLTFNKPARIKKLAKQLGRTLTFDDLIGSDSSFKKVLKLARAAARGDANILLLGESGTGKDLLAQAIHSASPFSDGPFVAINCAAIPGELIASELFGYVDGVFTGGVKGGKAGKFELAAGGTLFLDEIGDMSLNLQTTLLRAIENRTFMRVGGDKEIPVNARIIAATNKDLLHEIDAGTFRADLYYRLNIMSIEMPPLRGRPDDIRLLIEYFNEKMAQKTGKPLLKISKQQCEELLAYNWPGNIRELNNLVARSYYFDMQELSLTESVTKQSSPPVANYHADNIEAFEKNLIKDLLEQNNYAVTEVARKIGQSRSTVYRKIKKYNISVNDATEVYS
ncbi:MAG: sigma 54-interacting transcriptional regulator [Syntrophomonas sp.]